MNFPAADIEKSKSHLLTLLEAGVFNIKVSQLNEFVNFIIGTIPPTSIKNTLLLTIQSYSAPEIRVFAERFIEESEFDNLIFRSFKLEKRKQLKKNLIQLEIEVEEALFDSAITKAFQVEKRRELKQKLKTLNTDGYSRRGKIIPIQRYLQAISIAAAIIFIFLIWQPQKESDEKVFAEYVNNMSDNLTSDYSKSELLKANGEFRGNDDYFNNFNHDQTLQLLEAIALVRDRNFKNANEIFKNFNIDKAKNPGLTLYIAIAQLNSGNLAEAKENLEYLAQLPNFLYADDAKFHLAFAYLQSGNRKKAKELLLTLANSKNKFTDEASHTLKRLRWF